MKRSFLLIAAAVSAFVQSEAPAQPAAKSQPNRAKVHPMFTDGVFMEGSVFFTTVEENRRRRLTLDVYKPTHQDGLQPAIVMFFGGGWQNGRPGLFAPLAQRLAQRGYVCVVPEYRLSGEAPFPAAAHDCKAAIRWTRANAKSLGIDPNRIATLGGSAGGHLSGFMGATNGVDRFEGSGDNRDQSSEVNASIVMCGPMNLLDPVMVERLEQAKDKPEGDAVLDFMGGALPSTNKAIYLEASPLTHVGAHAPPMLFIDGELDRPEVRYTEFRKKLDAHGIPHEFVLMPGAPHPFWVSEEWFEPTVGAVDAFLKKHLPAR